MKKNILKNVGLILMIGVFTLFIQNLYAQNENNENHPPREQPKFADLLQKMDKNKDGKIALAEAEGPLKNDFTKIDTNKDGFITEKEFKSAPHPDKKGPKPEK